MGGTVLMAAAMADLALGWAGLAPLLWTLILAGWALVAAGAARWRPGRAAVVYVDALHLLHQLGLVVVAGQIALCSAMADGAAATPGAGAGLAHPHAMSVFAALVYVAGALFVLAAAAMVLSGQRSRPERGNLLSMSVMTAAMALMPFG